MATSRRRRRRASPTTWPRPRSTMPRYRRRAEGCGSWSGRSTRAAEREPTTRKGRASRGAATPRSRRPRTPARSVVIRRRNPISLRVGRSFAFPVSEGGDAMQEHLRLRVPEPEQGPPVKEPPNEPPPRPEPDPQPPYKEPPTKNPPEIDPPKEPPSRVPS